VTRSGATAFVDALGAAGTQHVFGNPGSTELAFLDALEARAGVEYVLCLNEVVAVGAADGYARVARRPGVVQLHTTAGVGNAVGMLTNARVGGTPLVVYVGCPSRAAAYSEPVLGGDPVALVGGVAKWAWEVRTANEIPTVVARAFKVAATPPMGPVVLVVPTDVMEEPCRAPESRPTSINARANADSTTIREVVARLLAAGAPAIVIGDGAAASGAGPAITAVAELLGAPVYGSYLTEAVLPHEHPLDAGALPLFDGIAAVAALAHHDLILSVGAPLLRVGSAQPFELRGDVIQIGSDPWELGKNLPATAILADERTALRQIAAELAAEPKRPNQTVPAARASAHTAADAVLAEVAGVLPEDTLLIDESVSAMAAVGRQLPIRPGAWFRSRGGALGAGICMSIGAALAEPTRPVVSILGDGAGMYAIQALWTAANRRLNTTFVVLDNGGYKILERSGDRGARSAATDLTRPRIDFAALAGSLGLAGYSATSATVAAITRDALANSPSLVHVKLDDHEAVA
jgi:benzoylformate decarboxylase